MRGGRRWELSPQNASMHDAVRFLASTCDGAVRRDGFGFAAEHVGWGHWLASLPAQAWGPAECAAAQHLIVVYRQQLHRAGFDVEVVLGRRPPRRIRRRDLERLSPRWEPDPAALREWRWWNGCRWTEHTASSFSDIAAGS